MSKDFVELEAWFRPKTANLTFSEALEAMMASPNQRWTCGALREKTLCYALGYFWERDRCVTSKLRLTGEIVTATDWRICEKE